MASMMQSKTMRVRPHTRSMNARSGTQFNCGHEIGAMSLVGLLMVLAVGCSEMTRDEAADVRKSFGLPADMPLMELGVVKLQMGVPKRVSVGWGKDCTVTATVMT